MRKFYHILALLCLATLAQAAGTVQQSIQQLPLGSGLAWAVVFHWTGDAANGSVPVTAAQIGQYAILQGYYITVVETVPGPVTFPTSGYGLTIKDVAGVDVLAGAASSLSASASQGFSSSPRIPPLNGTFTLNITGQSVPSAKGTVYVYLQDPGTLIGSGQLSISQASVLGSPVASASTITPSVNVPDGLFHITGTAAISTMNVPATLANGAQICAIADGLWSMGTGGNIALAVTAVVNRMYCFGLDLGTNKWYPNSQ